jgi:hypothetical protein
VALKQYKITYKDGSTQMVSSTSPATQGSWLVFDDGTDEILRVPAADVESVSDPDQVPDRVPPGSPIIG